MKISAVRVRNYRGIIDAEVFLCDYSILLGANNAGKSTFLSAMCAFYDHDQFKYKKNKDWPHSGAIGEEAWVEIEFKLTSQEASSLKDEYLLPGSILIVRKYLHSDIKAHDGKARSGAFYGKTTKGFTHDDFFYGSRNVAKGKLGDVIYIPAVSRVEDHAKLSGPSALRDLLNDLLKDIFSTSHSYQTLAGAFGDFGEKIRCETTAGGRSLAGLQELVQNSISSWGVEFSIEVRPPDATELVKSLSGYSLRNIGSDHSLAAEDFGSGFQRNFIYSLINVKAAYTEPKKIPSKKTFAPELSILLFEEPEAFLHPPQQEKLSDSLKSLSRSSSQQVVCSTHSPNFVSYNSQDLKSICRFTRSNGVVDAGQVTDEIWLEIVSFEGEISEDEAEAIERIKFFLWLNPDRCGALFSELVLLVEGATDQVIIRKLVRDGKIKISESGLHVLDCLGKWNIPRFSRLLGSLGIEHCILFDEDDGKPNHVTINTRIRSLVDYKNVRSVISLPRNIETTLGIPPCKLPSQKPAMALRLLEESGISEDLLDSFCGLVSGCLDHAKE